jgi:histidine triad (HIT) family protein
MSDCIFCKIVNGELPTKKVFESANAISFYDIKPSAQTHILIVPKIHIETFMDLNDGNKDLLAEMFEMARKIISDKKIEGKYRVSFNGGSLQVVPHLHMHILGGELKREHDN